MKKEREEASCNRRREARVCVKGSAERNAPTLFIPSQRERCRFDLTGGEHGEMKKAGHVTLRRVFHRITTSHRL